MKVEVKTETEGLRVTLDAGCKMLDSSLWLRMTRSCHLEPQAKDLGTRFWMQVKKEKVKRIKEEEKECS